MAGSPNPLTGTNVFIATINAPGANEDVSQAVMARALQPVLNNTVYLKTFVDARALTTIPAFPADEGKLIVATATGGPLAVKTPAQAGVAASVHSHAQGDITSLGTDLALKAPLASPALTGTPTAPTATAGANTTQLATTAFVTTGLANKANTSHAHAVVDLTATGTRDATTFLRGDNTWATPASSGLAAAANELITGNWTFDGSFALTRGGRYMDQAGQPARYLSNLPNMIKNPSGEIGIDGWTVLTAGGFTTFVEADGRVFRTTATFEIYTDVPLWRASKDVWVSGLPAFQCDNVQYQIELLDAAGVLVGTNPLVAWTFYTAAGFTVSLLANANWVSTATAGFLRVRLRGGTATVHPGDMRFRGIAVNYGVPAIGGGIPSEAIRFLYDRPGGGTALTVQEADGTPIVLNADTIKFGSGFTVTDQAAGDVLIDYVPTSGVIAENAVLKAAPIISVTGVTPGTEYELISASTAIGDLANGKAVDFEISGEMNAGADTSSVSFKLYLGTNVVLASNARVITGASGAREWVQRFRVHAISDTQQHISTMGELGDSQAQDSWIGSSGISGNGQLDGILNGLTTAIPIRLAVIITGSSAATTVKLYSYMLTRVGVAGGGGGGGSGGGGIEGVPIDSDGRTTAYTTATAGKPVSQVMVGNGLMPRQRSTAQGGGTNWQHNATTNALTFTAGMEPVTGEVITYWY